MNGNRDQHIANGGCPAIHPNGQFFCQGMAGHYNFFSSKHFVKVVDHRTRMTETMEWN